MTTTMNHSTARRVRYADVKLQERAPDTLDLLGTETTTVALDLPFPQAQALVADLWNRMRGNGRFVQAWIVEVRPIGHDALRDAERAREEARQAEWDRRAANLLNRRSI